MADLAEQIIAYISKKNYAPLKAKVLAGKLGLSSPRLKEFRRALRSLLREGRIELGKNHTIRKPPEAGSLTGTYRRTTSGVGYVRPVAVEGRPLTEIRIGEDRSGDASTGDVVLVRLLSKPTRGDGPPNGVVVKVLERATRQFVGTYFERDGDALVRVDGNIFAHSVRVGDPGAKGAKPNDKVVFEMVRFPTVESRGEGVLTEVLGPHGQPGVDTLSIIRSYGLPDAFPDDALQEARLAADTFDENDLAGREDFTRDLVITIDPVDARDFDDAIGLTRDETTGHYELRVHIADVGHFAPPGGALDREARKRATSVYLPQRVIPMFPELVSNHLASLQPDRVRYVKTAIIGYTPEGTITHTRFAEGAIRSKRRFSYEQVMMLLEANAPGEEAPEVFALLCRMRDLALILRQRRRERGSLELSIPEVQLTFDDQGQVSGGYFRTHDLSHQIIEEFMLAANEAVAAHLDGLKVPFLRRVHPAPDPLRMRSFSDFARSLGYKMKTDVDRFSLQRVLEESADKPERYALHYALLRAMKQAVYSPTDEEHYALASVDYCHFTSPIRRYPDLVVHRQLGQWLRTGRAGGDFTELAALGDHCSKMERRAEAAERELIKVKLLSYLSERIGLQVDAVITGVADYGFFAQGETLPIEGLVHVSTLPDDYYYFEEATHSLLGQRRRRSYQLGDKVRVEVVRVDLHRRQLDFRVLTRGKE
jgi:ribonuclease R